MSTPLKSVLEASRRAGGQKGLSTKSLYLGIADSAAMLITLAVAGLLGEFTRPTIAYAAVPFGLVLLSSFRLVAVKAAERASRARLQIDDVVSTDLQIEEDYESEIARIDKLAVPQEKKERLRLEAFEEQRSRRQELRSGSARPALVTLTSSGEIPIDAELRKLTDPPRSSGFNLTPRTVKNLDSSVRKKREETT